MRSKKEILFYILSMLAIMAVLVYLIVRIAFFIVADFSWVDKTFALFLLLAEGFILVHATGYLLNIIKVLNVSKKSDSYKRGGMNEINIEPSVAILVPARDEPKEVLEETFIAINNIDYHNKEIYFLDDSSKEKYKREAKQLAEEYNLNLFRRTKPRHGAKGGIINDCLEELTEKYIVIFDADQNPMPQFLNELVPLMEKDEDLAFIQTPQCYTNIEDSKIARGAGFQQAVFYEYISEGKSTGQSMFYCGTNVIIRRKALEEVGGLDESTVTEDFASSVKILSKGYKSYYYNSVSTFGKGPENLTEYYKQQFRWANGTIGVLKQLIKRLFTDPLSLSLPQWWEYMLSSTYYFIGVIFFILMICPIAYLLFNIPTYFVNPKIYALAFFPYIMLSMGIFYMVLSSRNYTKKDLLSGQLLGFTGFSVYIKAAIFSMLGIKADFGITGKAKANTVSYLKLWPQLLMITINFVAIVWGMNRFIYENDISLIVNSAWAFYHFLILSSIFYFNSK